MNCTIGDYGVLCLMDWKLGSNAMTSAGGDKLFSHSFMKSEENRLILLGVEVKVLRRAAGSSPSVAGALGDDVRSSLLDGFLLRVPSLSSFFSGSAGMMSPLTVLPLQRAVRFIGGESQLDQSSSPKSSKVSGVQEKCFLVLGETFEPDC